MTEREILEGLAAALRGDVVVEPMYVEWDAALGELVIREH